MVLLPLSILALLEPLFRNWIGARFQPKQLNDDQFGYDAAKPNARFERTELSANERDYSVLSSRHLEPNNAAAGEVEGVTLIEIEPNEFDEALNIHVEEEGLRNYFQTKTNKKT
jgi:hypothetical protein